MKSVKNLSDKYKEYKFICKFFFYKIEVHERQGVCDPEMDLLTKRYYNQEMTCWEMTVWGVLLQ